MKIKSPKNGIRVALIIRDQGTSWFPLYHVRIQSEVGSLQPGKEPLPDPQP